MLKKLNVLGKTIREDLIAQAQASADKKRMDELNSKVGELNQKLTKYYGDMVTSPRNRGLLAKWHEEHEKILGAASHDWQVEQSYPRESGSAAVVAGRIDSLEGRLWSVDGAWTSVPDRLRQDVKAVDAAIANNPCHTYQSLPNYAQQPNAVHLYDEARPVMLKVANDVQVTIKNDNAIMKGIDARASRY